MEKTEHKRNRLARTGVLAVFALLCSLLLWIYVVENFGQDSTQTYPGVQVRFEGETLLRDTRELIVTESSSVGTPFPSVRSTRA